MQNFARLMGLGALVLAANLLAPSQAQAQVVTNDCFTCVPCDYDKDGISGDGHRVTRNRVAPGAAGLTTPEPNECGAGTCAAPQDELHEACVRPSSTAFSIQKLNEAALSGDVFQLAAMIQDGGDAVEVNTARGAVQVIGCTGAVVAHIPVSRELLARIPAASARLAAAE